MAKKENKFKGYDISTQAVHTGVGYDAETGAVRRPLHMANSYKLPDDLSKVNYSSTDLLMYARNGNPNQHWLEEKVAALHNADDAIVLASGVARPARPFLDAPQDGRPRRLSEGQLHGCLPSLP
ncbi:PLP-dependent transferase [Megasphaera sp.]|uniref:PLP-dependent transferase n=1 Tax=Megasphaera sp. TaxID=2023260 RepID=UPI003522CF7D